MGNTVGGFNYPNENVPDEVKNSETYGLTVANYIYTEHFRGNSYYDKRQKMVKVRSHMKGDIDTSQFGDIFGIDQDASTLSLNWEPPRILAKYINVVADGFPEDIYRVKATAIDEISNRDRMMYTESMKNAMLAKGFNREFNETFSEQAGMQFGPPESEIPETTEELDLNMKLNYRQKREIAAELTVKKVLKYNNFDEETRQKCNEWLCLHGEGGFRLQRHGGVLDVRLADPINMIYPPDSGQQNDKRNTQYFGEVLKITVGELKTLVFSYGTTLSDEDWNAIISSSSDGRGELNNHDENGRPRPYDDNEFVTIIDFAYKTTNKITRQRKVSERTGGVKMIKKEDSWPGNQFSDKIQEPYDVWYEGLYVVGMNKLMGYRKFTDMPRKKGDISKTYGPFVYYELSTESLGSRIITYAEQIYMIYIKIQQLIIKLKPKGIAIDVSRLADIDLGDEVLKPSDVIKIYNEDGNLLYSGESENGDPAGGMPVIDLPGGDGRELSALINAYDYYIQKIREDTGINEARDASSPNPNAAVGVQEQAHNQSLNATKHIQRGIWNLYINLSNTILAHVQHMVASKHESDMLKSLIGSFSYDVLQAYLKMPDNEFNMSLELKPTAEQVQGIRMLTQKALEGQQITLPEAAEIESTENYKVALALLAIRIDKRQQAAAKQEEMNIQAQAQADQFKLENEMEKEQAKLDMTNKTELAKINAQRDADIAVMRAERMLEREFGSGKVADANQIEDHKSDKRKEEIEMKDGNKKTLAAETATQQSEMITQRSKDEDPKNFEQQNIVNEIVANAPVTTE